jgi:hypothetical protein
METKKVNKKAIRAADGLALNSNITQLQAQNVSPPINGATQFTTGSQSSSKLFPQAPNYANQGITDMFGQLSGDWFWESWMRNAQKNNMQSGGQFNESGVMPNIGKVFLPEEFWAYAQAKQEQGFQEDFNRFVFSQVDVTTPQGRAWWEKKYPGYTQRVYDAYSLKMQIQAKIAEIQIKGFQSEGDLWFAYLYQNKYFDRMLAPPVDRLQPLSTDVPQTTVTNPVGSTRLGNPNVDTTAMPAIPRPT